MINCLVFALAYAVVGFILFRSLWLRSKTTWLRAAILIIALVFAVPAFLFLSNYLLHKPDGVWFISARSLSGVEALSGLIGSLLGVMFASARLRPRRMNAPILVVSTTAALILLIAPFGKQLFFPLDYSRLEDRWVNGVCAQTSLSTCVPASCATVVRMLGGGLTERQIATEAGTNARGTEIWYAMRAMRRHGYQVQAKVAKSLKDVPAPAILGVMVGDSGHVVVLISKSDAGPEIGDPLGIRRQYTCDTFEKRYCPKLVYFVVKPVRGGT